MADGSLNIPDFRAAERTFSLITQVSGRAGRGTKKGEVVIQAFNPEHYSIQAAIAQDYQQFYQKEIQERKQFGFPPFSRFIKLLIRGQDPIELRTAIFSLRDKLMQLKSREVDILGPAPCPIAKISKNFRWQMILRAPHLQFSRPLAQVARESLVKEGRLYLEIDVDPVSMM